MRQILVRQSELPDTEAWQSGAIRQALQQSDTARCARSDFNGAFAGERLQMLFGGVSRSETQSLRDLCTGWGKASVVDCFTDQAENLLLPGG